MAKNKTILVIGASYGGLHAAASARRRDEDARICVIEKGPLSHEISSREEIFCRRHSVELIRAGATGLDPDSRSVSLVARGRQERMPYDALVYAGGVLESHLSVPGLLPEHVISFFNVHHYLTKSSPIFRHVVIIGCGINGIETAIEFNKAGYAVTLVDKRHRILPEFSRSFSHAILAKLKSEGIAVLLGNHVIAGNYSASGKLELKTHQGATLETGLVVGAMGLRPQVSLLADAGAALDIDGFVRVDDHMATTLPHVFACGNAIKTPVILTNERKWLVSKMNFQQSALIAGNNAGSIAPAFDVVTPSCQTMTIATTEYCFARTGLSEEQARVHLGDDNLLVSTVYEQRLADTTDQLQHCVRLLLDKKRHVIVGGEISGDSNVCGRISILSQAVRDGYTPEQLLTIDMVFDHDNDVLLLDPLKEAALRAQFHFVHDAPIISADTLALWLKSNRDFRLVDVSDAPAFSGRRAQQMLHVPLARLRKDFADLEEPDMPIVIFSTSVEQSQLAQRALMHRGRTNVYNLDGGIAAFAMVFAEEKQ